MKNKPEGGKERKPLEARRTDRGPEPERLKIDGNWKAAVRVAMQKRKPPGGWPK
jgi:hypothetical protein